MPRRQPHREDIIDDSETLLQECVEVKLESREEEILRQLGVIHLENKFTRPRYHNDETDAMILQQAGVKLLCTDDWLTISKSKNQVENEEKWSNKSLSEKEAEILRSAGVTLLDDIPISYDDDSFCHKLDCATSATVSVTVGESTVNSSYAEKELLRRLKKGWSSTGEKCLDCGLPIIRKSKGNNLLECVICGVVGGEDNFNPDTAASLDVPTVGTVDEMEIPGILQVGTFMSTITPGTDGNGCESHYHEQPLDRISKEKETNEDEMDSKYNEELGRRLFDGWKLSTSKCTQCNKPLVSEFDGAPCVCLICG
jgi:uncharacterized Zn finger protein (UPF0148 family)